MRRRRAPRDRAARSSPSAFLADACAGDDELRREVESLLAHDGGTAFLSTPAVAHGIGERIRIGQAVGPSLISAPIGEGGMGEVYRAHDPKLGRDVAIKILSGAFTADPARLARFEREARLLASLNHPHIGAIYGVEESGGILALVLELVEGKTLADKLVGEGSLPVPEALAIGRQIADALDAAHERGIVHRDLKPANIAITHAGTVKVLDFGLAKVVASDAFSPELSKSPTVTVNQASRHGLRSKCCHTSSSSVGPSTYRRMDRRCSTRSASEQPPPWTCSCCRFHGGCTARGAR